MLIGPSGCGKSTILRMINRLIEPTSGQILLDGEDIAGTDPVKLRRRIGYVIQNTGLFPHQTIAANVATVPGLLGWKRATRESRVAELLELVGLRPGRYARRYPHELSGGQRQRVGVARALAADPVVLLMDEPFSAVDPIVRVRLQDEFLRLQAEVRKTIVLVTHDLDEAVRLGDRIAVLSQGGRLEQYASAAAPAARTRRTTSSPTSSAPTGASSGWRSPRSTAPPWSRWPATTGRPRRSPVDRHPARGAGRPAGQRGRPGGGPRRRRQPGGPADASQHRRGGRLPTGVAGRRLSTEVAGLGDQPGAAGRHRPRTRRVSAGRRRWPGR